MRLLSVVLVLVALAAAGCGSSAQTSTTTSTATGASTVAASPAQTATAKFVLHAAVAFGAFHRYIYTPLKAGELKSLAGHRPVVARAAAAAFLVGHELKLATAAAKASPALNALDTQLAVLSDGFAAALVRLKAGHFNPVEIQTAASAIEGIERGAAAAGAPIAEHVPAVP
jgi:hypothetical protein